MLGFYGRDLGLRIARKHLGWYAAEAQVAPALRLRLMTETDPAGVLGLIARAFAEAPERAAA
jgi:tRNA-dihydrouridine synthase